MTTKRTCVGCRGSEAPGELVRLVLGPDGDLVVDPRGGSFGRGAWLHARPDCVARGVPRGVAHALKANVKSTPEDVARQLRAAGLRRALALVGAAFRARKAAVGATAALEAIQGGSARLVVVTRDARAAAHAPAVVAALAAGAGVVIGTKAELGAVLGRAEAGVVAILDEGIGASLRQAVAFADFAGPRTAGSARTRENAG